MIEKYYLSLRTIIEWIEFQLIQGNKPTKRYILFFLRWQLRLDSRERLMSDDIRNVLGRDYEKSHYSLS
jgi:hypothetical protein